MKILLVEDEAELAAAVRGALQRENYVVDWADRIDIAREAARSGMHDLVLLDRTLPDGDGLSLIAPLRSYNPGVPVIVLSARGELSDRIAGLDEGADDYLAKPFALEELLARIRAIRRRPNALSSEEVRVGRLVFDLDHEEASVDGKRLDLPRREVCVLAALIRRRGRTVLREALEQAVYGFDDEIQSNTLDSHISRLRRKLAEAGAGAEIHAIRGVGYLLKAVA
jgi:two-component system OmpR family response regulator